jgi:hypothetical protein
VIRIASRRNAGRLSENPEYGLLEAGKIADLIILDANPLEDIRNTRKIARVMQAGRWLDRAALKAMPGPMGTDPTGDIVGFLRKRPSGDSPRRRMSR